MAISICYLSERYVTECRVLLAKRKVVRIRCARRWPWTHVRAHLSIYVRVGQHTHARANSRSNARVSQSRIADFSHMWLPFLLSFQSDFSLRLNSYHTPSPYTFSRSSIFPSHYSFSSASNEQPLRNHTVVLHNFSRAHSRNL